MSWIKKSLFCFHHDKRNRCECNKEIGSKSCSVDNVPIKSEVSDKNIQCNFDEELCEEDVGNLLRDKGQYFIHLLCDYMVLV